MRKFVFRTKIIYRLQRRSCHNLHLYSSTVATAKLRHDTDPKNWRSVVSLNVCFLLDNSLGAGLRAKALQWRVCMLGKIALGVVRHLCFIQIKDSYKIFRACWNWSKLYWIGQNWPGTKFCTGSLLKYGPIKNFCTASVSKFGPIQIL